MKKKTKNLVRVLIFEDSSLMRKELARIVDAEDDLIADKMRLWRRRIKSKPF